MSLLSRIETFVQIVEQGSLAGAARQLGISSAAVSKQLAALEGYLGAQLLIRSTRGFSLTDIGLSYYQQSKKVLKELQEAHALISHTKEEPQGELKVVSGRHFAQTYLIPHLARFLSCYPKLQLSLELAERMPNLEEEGVDVLVGMSLSATGEVIQRRIATTRYVLCGSPDYFKKWGKPHKPKDLIHHRYLTHSMRYPVDQLTFAGQEAVSLNPYLSINDTETLLLLAKSGMGLVKLHDYVVKEALLKGELEEVLEDYAVKDLPLYIAFLHRRFIASKVRCFIQFVDEVIKMNE